MKIIPYVSFNGNCEEAVIFYHSVFGGSLDILRNSDMPTEGAEPVNEQWKDKIMHSCLTIDEGCYLYFSDSWEGTPVVTGANTTIHIIANTEEDVYRLVNRLAEGGEITMPAEKTFWNSVYGSLTDKFGVSWGIEFELKS